jgi:hypothetical protein
MWTLKVRVVNKCQQPFVRDMLLTQCLVTLHSQVKFRPNASFTTTIINVFYSNTLHPPADSPPVFGYSLFFQYLKNILTFNVRLFFPLHV